jgi:hypothetical protein
MCTAHALRTHFNVSRLSQPGWSACTEFAPTSGTAFHVNRQAGQLVAAMKVRFWIDALGVFAGGVDLGGCGMGLSGSNARRKQPAEPAGAPRRQSLVVVGGTSDDSVRYRMLETIRRYAREHLAPSDVDQSAARGHATYYLALAEQAEPELTGADGLAEAAGAGARQPADGAPVGD